MRSSGSQASRVLSAIITWPPRVKDSMRAATLMVVPTTLYLLRFSEPMLPATTVPVLMPMPMFRSG